MIRRGQDLPLGTTFSVIRIKIAEKGMAQNVARLTKARVFDRGLLDVGEVIGECVSMVRNRDALWNWDSLFK